MSARDSGRNISSLEMILRDTEGDHIHATVRNAFIDRHKKYLEEGKTCIISHFNVNQNTGSYRTTDHPYRVYFMYSTSVRPFVDDGLIHKYGFAFRSFTQVLAPQFDERYLVDVIGKLSAVGELDSCVVNGETQHRVDVELVDEELERLECTLWGKFADAILDFMSRPFDGPIIVIIQSCKAKEFKGRKKLSNSMFSSRLLINPMVPEVDQFIKKMRTVGVDVDMHPVRISPHATLTIADELLGLTDQRQIVDLRTGPEGAEVVVLAELVDIRVDRGWTYTACKQCGKKVLPDGSAFFCDKCETIVKAVIPRFLVTCEVVDDSGSCNLVIFDREFSKLVGCSAAELKERILREELEDTLPVDMVHEVIHHHYLFKIKIPQDYVSGQSSACKVLRMTRDKEIIASYVAALHDNQGISDLNPGGVLEEQDADKSFTDSEGASSSIVAVSDKIVASASHSDDDVYATSACKKLKYVGED